MVREMRKILPENWLQFGALANSDYLDMEIPKSLAESQSGRKLHLVAKDSIVFAGGNRVKGRAITTLIDDNKFSQKPDIIIFIDNEPKNTQEFAREFEDRPEQVYIFDYPHKLDKACPEPQAVPERKD